MDTDHLAVASEAGKFFDSTRGQIVLLLLEEKRTVKELAEELDLTDNAVRAHLVALERDGLVRQEGERRSGGRPAYLYEVTPAADELFPKAYDVALTSLIAVLEERVDEETVRELLREAGRRAAEQVGATGPDGSGEDLDERLESAVGLLRELGGMPKVSRENGKVHIRNQSCLFSGVISDHPEACLVAQGMLEFTLGEPVEGSCEPRPGGRAACVFSVARD